MNLSLFSESERFIDDQVRIGRFPTREAVVEAALAGLRENAEQDLDESAIAAINEAEAQADRGQGMDIDAFRARISRRFHRA